MPPLAHLFHDLVRFETELWNALDARLQADHGLPLTWFEPMSLIDRRERARVNDIADELAITIGGTSKLVDRIEAAGHCRRVANPDDRRSSLIELTPAGAALLAAATTTFDRELERRLGAVLSPAALDRLAATLGRLRAAGHQLDENEPEVTR